jgi:hypothetical protein
MELNLTEFAVVNNLVAVVTTEQTIQTHSLARLT